MGFFRLGVLLVLLPLVGQAQPNPCKQYVLAAYERFAQRYNFGGARPVAQLKMLVETSYRQPAKGAGAKPKATRQLIEAERQGEFLHFRDGKTEAYQSPGQIVTILRDKRMVAVTNATMLRQPEFAPSMQLLRTYIIEQAPIESCVSRKQANGHTYRQVVFLAPTLTPQVRQLAGIQKLIVSIDEKTQGIASFRVQYAPTQSLSEVSYTLLEEAPQAGPQLLRPAFEYVLTSGNQLRPEFAGFQLIDQRRR